MLTPTQLKAAELDRRIRIALKDEYDRFVRALSSPPLEFDGDCALYTRESDPTSLVGDAAVNQLRTGLELLLTNGCLPPWENVYFENETATEMAVRFEFQDLVQRAMAGEFKVIGAYISSRLFRNADEASAVKKQLKRRGVRLMWIGKPVGMDERDPNLWLMERNADTQDEWHSRNTGWLVGRQLEYKTRKGEPIGHLPECWSVAERAPGHRPGQVGRPIRWELAEPMATVVRQAAQKALGGSSWRDIARWSAAGPLGGLTPGGRLMHWRWWSVLLQNPKVAGLHESIRYPGYKAGKESPTNKEQGIVEELVPCLLPALITVDEWQEIRRLSHARHAHGKTPAFRSRPDHKVELLSGIAFDARCGQRVHIVQHMEDDYRVRCLDSGADRHGSSFRARHAGDALDDLVAGLAFDPTLVAEIEASLRGRAATEPSSVAVANPAATRLKAAIAAMSGDEELLDARRILEGKLRLLEQSRPHTVPARKSPIAIFRLAVASITQWPGVWSSGTPAERNAILRAAGVRAFIEPVPHGFGGARRIPGPRSRLVRLEVDVPEFALALAVGAGQSLDAGRLGSHKRAASIDRSRVQIVVPAGYAALVGGGRQDIEAA
jgi:DNA invertase Pin-like site-specific DNA recombinase